MVVDTSALTAIVLGEPDAEDLLHSLTGGEHVHVSAASLLEAQIVVEARQGADAVRDLELLLEETGALIEPVDREIAEVAHRAWQRFGKGRHPAALNVGECFVYALCQVRDEPLLHKGDDFTQTDLRLVSG